MEKPLVSVIIRTCGRPSILKKALESIRSQTYTEIETVIIEDGSNMSESFIATNFSDLNITYQYTGMKVGRCKAGNLGLARASGKYINFLDDDDFFMPCHVETLITQLLKTNSMAAYSIAEEHQIRQTCFITRQNAVKRKLIRYRQPYNKLLLCYMNYIPIQSIMFSRKLYETLGGFDEKLEVLEDWDLWIRYSTYCDFLYVPVLSSVYHTPYKSRQKHQRDCIMQRASLIILEKQQQYNLLLTVSQINQEINYIVNIFNKKGFLFYMQKIRNFLLYRDI